MKSKLIANFSTSVFQLYKKKIMIHVFNPFNLFELFYIKILISLTYSEK